MSSKIKQSLTFAAKIIFAGVLVYYLYRTGRIDFKLIFEKLNAKTIFICCLIWTGIIFINNFRWKILLKVQEINVGFWQLLQLSYIGLFFNTFMPGSVGGDIFKAYYIANDNPDRKTRAVLTVILDRFVGLLGLLIVATLGTMMNLIIMKEQPPPELISILFFITISLGILVLLMLVGISGILHKHPKFEAILNKLPLSNLLKEILETVFRYRNARRELLATIMLSLPVHTLIVIACFLVGRELGDTTIPFWKYFAIIPVGVASTSIPVAPAGLGVGQAAFAKLFEWIAGIKSSLGANIISIVQIVMLLYNFLGMIFYLRKKSSKGTI